MLNYNQIKPRSYIIYEGEPWEVLESQVSRKQANKPVNKTKLRNLVSPRVIECTFHVSDKVHEADVEKKDIKYLYTNPKNGEIWFSEIDNPRERFTIHSDVVGDSIKYITENSTLRSILFVSGEEDVTIGIDYPQKIDLVVSEAPPNIKGDTATGGKKTVVLETGVTITTPLFIEVGDTIRINIEKGEYVERVSKG